MKIDEEVYPTRCCNTCAMNHGGKEIINHIPHLSTDICDICNEWKMVSIPEDFAYPDFKTKKDNNKILSALMGAYIFYIDNKWYSSALQISSRIDIILASDKNGEINWPPILSKDVYNIFKSMARELADGTNVIISRGSDSEDATGDSVAQGSIGTCPQKPIC